MASQVPARRREERGLARRENPFMELRRQMDDLFSSFFGGFPALERAEPENLRLWDFDATENENEVTVRAELPGFEPNEIDVQLNQDLLTIKAEKREKHDGREEYQSYRRSLMLPPGVDVNKVQANYHNGVLELHIPRSEQAKPRKIQIQAEKPQEGQPQIQAGQQQGSQQPTQAKAKK